MSLQIKSLRLGCIFFSSFTLVCEHFFLCENFANLQWKVTKDTCQHVNCGFSLSFILYSNRLQVFSVYLVPFYLLNDLTCHSFDTNCFWNLFCKLPNILLTASEIRPFSRFTSKVVSVFIMLSLLLLQLEINVTWWLTYYT